MRWPATSGKCPVLYKMWQKNRRTGEACKRGRLWSSLLRKDRRTATDLYPLRVYWPSHKKAAIPFMRATTQGSKHLPLLATNWGIKPLHWHWLYSNLSRYFKQCTIFLSSGSSQDFLMDLVKADSKLSTVEEFVSSVTPSCCCPNSRRKNMWHLSQASQTEVGQAALWLGHLGQIFGGFICKSGLRCTQILGRTVWD